MFNHKKRSKKLIISFFVLFFVLSGVFGFQPETKAQVAIVESIPEKTTNILDKIKEIAKKLWSDSGQQLLNTVVGNTLNRIAYDAADQLMSGKDGQKPLFTPKLMGEYYKDIGLAAAGDFLDGLNDLGDMNLCEPNVGIKAMIGLGLVDYKRPPEPSCGAKEMVQAWEDEYQKFKDMKDMSNKELMQKVVGSFNPTSSDLSITASLFQGMESTERAEIRKAEQEMSTTQGKALEKTSPGGKLEEAPGQSQRSFENAQKKMSDNVDACDGDNLFLCAGSVFINHLAMKGFERALEYAFAPDETDPLADFDPYDFTDPDSDPAVVYQKDQPTLSRILEPDFTERADYDILSQLSVCPKSNIGGQDFVPAPNNCVIDEQFSLAITEQKTVGEALNEGYLHKDWRFKGLNEEVAYNEAYSYRSILILKKYRIVPAGWEEAIYRVSENQPATLGDLVSCFSPDDEYNDFSQGFTPKSWCRGLIDPRWVLKLPSHYCAKEGYGHIVQKEVTEGQEIDNEEGEDDYVPSNIFVTRTDDYCADEQSCIKENSNGTCEVYGYCNEEKRTWNFNQDSCDPVYNSCQTFENKDTGQKISYLKNTLDYGDCTSDSAGCSFYSYGGPYNVNNDKVDWKSYNSLYLNNNTEPCAESDEGCSQMIRIKPGYGHNFIKNGSFEEVDFDVNFWDSCSSKNCLVDDAYSGDQALEVNNENLSVEVGPKIYDVAGKTYTFSFYAKDCQENDTFGFIDGKVSLLQEGNDWKYYRLNHAYSDDNYFNNKVDLFIDSNSCVIDDVKLELGDTGTRYSDYGSNNVVYQKMLPEYLWDDCYENYSSGNLDFSLKEDAPDVCSDFSRFCNADEAGCNIYTNVEEKDEQVIAQVSTQDYCFGECNNYDIYVETESYFNSSQGAKFIPNTATGCSATDAGCTEFTNLDTLEAGGEAREYYKSLKQCIKPNDECTTFYVWQGSDGSGYQLESYNLQKQENTNEPLIVGSDTLCSEEIYNLDISDPAYNPDCYQFYNTDGEVSYHSYSKTVTCSENCHPYRMSEKNVVQDINTSAECYGFSRDDVHWDTNSNACYYCKNGGDWSNEYNACVYQAIPGQGETCSQDANKCREYNGNTGNNVKIVKTFDFKDSVEGWSGNDEDAVSLSNEALGQDDQSLKYKVHSSGVNIDTVGETMEVEIGGYSLNRGSSYSLKFLAKVDTLTDLNVYFENERGLKSYFEVINVDSDNSVSLIGDDNWHQYELNLDSLDHMLSSDEALVMKSNYGFYLDKVVLKEIVDKYYLIEDSWETPNKCYYDTLNNYQGVDYNLGCSEYSDVSGASVFLRSFSSLCQESAVGCQLMVDTHDSKDYRESIYNDENDNNICDQTEKDCVKVDADEYVYAVYDSNNTCSAELKSCQRLGESSNYGDQVLFSDVYLKNDPDKYSTILCSEDDANCESWISDTGDISYFKNPGNKVCEWKEGDNDEWNWYKKSINKCDENNNGQADEFENICTNSSDCFIPGHLLNEDQGGQNTCSNDDDCRMNFCSTHNVNYNNGKLPSPGRCSLSGNSCRVNSDCPNTNSCNDGSCVYNCAAPEDDFACPVDSGKTIGFGGGGNQVYQPTNDWVGVCENKASTCSEYIDPVSDYSINALSNPSFLDLNEDGVYGDKWSKRANSAWQNVNLVANRAYVFAVNNLNNSNIKPYLKCDEPIKALNSDNEFFEVNKINLSDDILNRYRVLLSSTDQFCQLDRGSDDYSSNNEFELIFKEAIIDYQLSKNLDTDTCNGKLDMENGCVLFNERSQDGSEGLNSLIYNAYDSYLSDSNSPQSVNNGDESLNANTLVKVEPNRVCAKWLACKTKIVDENGDITCYDVADCDALDKDGECANFLQTSDSINTFDTVRDKNSTGYSVLNKYNVSNMNESGSTPQSSSFDFEGEDSRFSGDADDDVIIVDEPAPLKGSEPDKTFNSSYPAEGKGFLKSKANKSVKSPEIEIQRNQQYYINYLLNTNDLTYGTKAKISILGINNDGEEEIIETWEDRSSTWDRKVYDFIVAGYDKIKIQISSDEVDDSRYIYIDDINIEPVLRASNDEFAAKSCRLYPKQDSLSCRSTNENVIVSGWEGYCLQKDPYNPEICLMWYPVDSISTFTNKDSGYQGKTPLYYCSKADGNFVLTEKRKPFYIDYLGIKCINKSHTSECELRFEKISSSGNSYSGGDYHWNRSLSSELQKYYVEYLVFAREDWSECSGNNEKSTRVFRMAIPKGVGEVKVRYGDNSWRNLNVDDGNSFYSTPISRAGNEKTYFFQPINIDNGCVDSGNHKIKFLDGKAWYPYNGIKKREGERAGDNISYGGESSDDDPLLKVYDYKTDELVSYKEYNVRCKQFEKVVNDDGSNKAWAVRSSKDDGNETTPGFLNKYYENNFMVIGLNDYHYNRDDQPYGSAYLSSDAWDDEIVFKNSNNEDNLESYAGLPYGCVGDSESGNRGCLSLGFCEDNPNLTCFVPNSSGDMNEDINDDLCGDLGNCIPYVEGLFGPATLPYDGSEILKNIFLKSYESQNYSNGNWVGGDTYDYSNFEGNEICSGGERSEDEFCAIIPQIKNIGLYKAGTEMNFNQDTKSFIVTENGNYNLRFNSIVDKEQLPLFEIVIDWGDGNVQTITDQDYRPNEDQPHVIDHNYIGIEDSAEMEIKIQIKDNWGLDRCCVNDDYCSYSGNDSNNYCPSTN